MRRTFDADVICAGQTMLFGSDINMEKNPLDPQDIERARTFWVKQDVDQVFNELFAYLDQLRESLKTNIATDKDKVQVMKLLDCLDWAVLSSSAQVVQVVIDTGEDITEDPPDMPRPSFCTALPSAEKAKLFPPLAPVQLQYQPHHCYKGCLPSLSSMPQSAPLFWGENPLRVPLLCGFRRLTTNPLMSPGKAVAEKRKGVEPAALSDDNSDSWDVMYKAPCGRSLCNYDEVLCFLLSAECYDVMQVDFFSFNPEVRLDNPVITSPQPEVDLSRGLEPTPVELCPTPGKSQPPEFRYRKDRWPHGSFLRGSGMLFSTCCDCTDGCMDAQSCACIAMTGRESNYRHQRLTEPVEAGVYECGPWCGCDRVRCQNRLIQRGIRVRLQVFQTESCGWGVRCRDDLDAGTFVCIYAGVMLEQVQPPAEPPPPKLSRVDLPSDDEVEVVTEWLAPPVLEGCSDPLETTPPTSTPLHVPVIQRPADASAALQAKDKVSRSLEKNGIAQESPRTLKRGMKVEDVYLLDARTEGNVSRFFNHSCQPNLFIQNVFTDSHDSDFPIIAFFTNSMVKAGTELTWNYSPDSHAFLQRQEVPCLCGSDSCRGQFAIEESLCGACGVQTSIRAT